MDKFSQLFAQYTHGEYDYLRVKSVEINSQNGTANIVMYVREDRYNNFDNGVIAVLDKFFRLFVKNLKLKYNFEPLLVSAEIVRRYLVEYLSVNYPFVAANAFVDSIAVNVKGEQIFCTVPLSRGMEDYIRVNRLQQVLQEELSRYYMTDVSVQLQICDTQIEGQQQLLRQVNNTVDVADVDYICGRKNVTYNAPVMLNSINRPYDMIAVCGRIGEVKENVQQEKPEDKAPQSTDQPAKKKRFKKYRYTFVLDDTTAKMSAYYRTNEENCPLRDISQGDVLAVGRVFFSDYSQSFCLSVVSLYRCKINFDQIDEATKPLPAPDKYQLAPLPARYSRKPKQLSLDDNSVIEDRYLTGNLVFLYLRCVPDGTPYQLCALKVIEGKPYEKYSSFLYMRDTSSVDVLYKSAVAAAPRAAELVGDLVKFCLSATVVTLQLEKTQKFLFELAKPQRYVFACDWYDGDLLLKKGKTTQSFAHALQAKHIDLASQDADDCAVALFELYEQANLR